MPETDIVILKTLLESGADFVSGNSLANMLGISRVGVWARLEKLREEEFEIEAIRHRGYRLQAEPPNLNERLMRAYLRILGVDLDVVYGKVVDSTNSEAERHLAAGRRTPFVVISPLQTSGRGRMGRRWHSPSEGNLYASFAFRPDLPPLFMQTITLWMGLKTCDFLNNRTGLPVKIKWPNDLFLNGKKVAGMLTEARIDADRTRDLIFGLGLNVNGRCEEWPPELARIATSLALEAGEPFSINQMAADLSRALLQAYEGFVANDFQAEMASLWQSYDLLHEQEIEAERDGVKIRGRAHGIDENGALLLDTDKGKRLRLHSGEVHLGSEVANSSR